MRRPTFRQTVDALLLVWIVALAVLASVTGAA